MHLLIGTFDWEKVPLKFTTGTQSNGTPIFGATWADVWVFPKVWQDGPYFLKNLKANYLGLGEELRKKSWDQKEAPK